MNSIPKGWPADWVGESIAELGVGERIRCEIFLVDGHTPLHVQNYADMMEQWSELWSTARKLIQTMLADYDRDTTIKSQGNYLKITIPAERISEGAVWSIALQKAEGDGVWEASFEGWDISPEESQPYF